MALDFNSKGLFGESNLFKISPEDSQVLVFQGGGQIPETPASPEEDYFRDDFTGNSLDETNRWVKVCGGTGTVTVSGGICTLETGTTINSSARIKMKIGKSLADYHKVRGVIRAKVTQTGGGGAIYFGIEDGYDTRFAHIKNDGLNEKRYLEVPSSSSYEISGTLGGDYQYFFGEASTTELRCGRLNGTQSYLPTANTEIKYYLIVKLVNLVGGENQKVEIQWAEIEGLNEPTPITEIYDQFTDAAINPIMWQQSVSGSGSISIGSGAVTLSTGATANSWAMLECKLPRSLADYSFLNFQFKIKMNTASGLGDGEIHYGIENSGHTKYFDAIREIFDAAGAIDIVKQDGTGELAVTTTTYTNDLYKVIKFKMDFEKNIEYIDDVVGTVSTTTTNLITDDMIIYFKIKNGAGAEAANKTMIIDYALITENVPN